ncbi:MAG: RNA methyltransferase [Ferruginibacter sp.]
MQVPPSLVNSLKNVKGFDEEAFLQVHGAAIPLTSIRINPQKINASSIASIFEDNIIDNVSWSSNGYYLKTRPSFTLDPLFHAGAYYVQEASSMFLEEALKQAVTTDQPIKVLDLCAAPGGKSTLIQSLISSNSLLVSNEVIKTRVNILAENITKWGSANVIVTNNDPKDFQRLPGYFDVIVVDAPCSGSGLFRKDPQAINEWSEQNVQLCSQRQQRILADVMPSLKPGGVLIYSTCSYSLEEDEDICDWLMDNYALSGIQYEVKNEWHIIKTFSKKSNVPGYRFYPDKLKGEGFFIAAFRKDGDEDEGNIIKVKAKTEKPTAAEIENVKPFLKENESLFFIKQNGEILAMPLHLENDFNIIRSALYLKKAGVKLGTVIRNELIPDHELAISAIIATGIPSLKVDKETALQYLRKQEIKIGNMDKGWVLIKYNQLPLGWVKVLPNRVNNYYPKDWRILNK